MSARRFKHRGAYIEGEVRRPLFVPMMARFSPETEHGSG